MTYKSGAEESFFDVVLRQYGDLNGVARLLSDNPGLLNANGELQQYRTLHNVQPGQTIAPTELDARETPEQPALNGPIYRSNTQQTFFDVCLMQYGGLGAIPFLLQDNQAVLEGNGEFLQFRKTHAIRPDYAYNANMKRRMLRLVPCTGAQSDEGFWITDDGQQWITDDGQQWKTDTQQQ